MIKRTPEVSAFVRRMGGVLLSGALLLNASAAGAESVTAPPAQTQNGIEYVTGGIGAPEAEAMKALAAQYPLALTFAKRSEGHEVFLAAVAVVIRDAAGATMLEVNADGPYLFAHLAPGTYTVSATYHGKEMSKRVSVSETGSTAIALVWAAEPGSADGAPNRPESGAAAESVLKDLPEARVAGGIPYLTGGIGSAETAAMRAVFKRYTLALTFARREAGHNVFLTDLPVAITDASGVAVFEATTDGPFLLIDLPAGTYQVSAISRGETRQAQVRVTAGAHLERAFIWEAAGRSEGD